MIAIREICNVSTNVITMRVPATFQSRRVEALILCWKTRPVQGDAFRELLLSAPTLTKTELDNYKQVRKRIKRTKRR